MASSASPMNIEIGVVDVKRTIWAQPAASTDEPSPKSPVGLCESLRRHPTGHSSRPVPHASEATPWALACSANREPVTPLLAMNRETGLHQDVTRRQGSSSRQSDRCADVSDLAQSCSEYGTIGPP